MIAWVVPVIQPEVQSLTIKLEFNTGPGSSCEDISNGGSIFCLVAVAIEDLDGSLRRWLEGLVVCLSMVHRAAEDYSVFSRESVLVLYILVSFISLCGDTVEGLTRGSARSK